VVKHDQRGSLKLEGDNLMSRNKGGDINWRTPLAALVLAAEYTTNEGPWIDDYFLDFWSNEGGKLLRHSTTFYVDGLDETMQALSQRLGAQFQLELCNSTQWTSRVIWPPELTDQPYFAFREVSAESWWARFTRLSFGPTLEYFLTDQVRIFLLRSQRCDGSPS
jgi:hypothetical protein